jgi:hypothetical protein
MHYTYRGTTNEREAERRRGGRQWEVKWVVNAKRAFHRPGGRRWMGGGRGVGRCRTYTPAADRPPHLPISQPPHIHKDYTFYTHPPCTTLFSSIFPLLIVVTFLLLPTLLIPPTKRWVGSQSTTRRGEQLFMPLFFFPSFLFVTKEKFQVGDPRITLIKSLETISIGSPTLETYIFDIDESKISTQLSLSLSCRVQN